MDGLEGDGGFELLDLQAADGGAGFPVHAAEGIAGGVVALAAHTGGVFEDGLMVAQGPDGRTGGQFHAGEGNDTRIDGDVIGLFFKFLHFGQAEGIAKLGGEGADRIMAAFVGAQHVLDLHGAVRAEADDPLDETASTELDGQTFIYIQPGDGQPTLIADLQFDGNFLAPKGTLFELALAGDVVGGLAGPDEADDVDPQE